MNSITDFTKYLKSQTGMSTMMAQQLVEHQNKKIMCSGGFNYINPSIIEERNLNVAVMDVFSRLMMDRVIFLGSEIDDYTANVVQAQLLYLASMDPEQDISIYINSPGGSVYAGLGIYDTMQYVNPDVSTICTGLAASMACVLLCAGANGKRVALPHARIMQHQPLTACSGQESDIAITAKEIKTLKKELYTIISEHTGQKISKIEKDCDRDFWMTSQMALDYGMIDKILTKENA